MPGDAATIEALVRTVAQEFERYAKVKKNVPEEALASVMEAEDPAKLADLVSGHLGIEVHKSKSCLKRCPSASVLRKSTA